MMTPPLRTRARLRAAVAIEYALLAGLIGVALIAGIAGLGAALDGRIDSIAESIGPTAPPAPPAPDPGEGDADPEPAGKVAVAAWVPDDQTLYIHKITEDELDQLARTGQIDGKEVGSFYLGIEEAPSRDQWEEYVLDYDIEPGLIFLESQGGKIEIVDEVSPVSLERWFLRASPSGGLEKLDTSRCTDFESAFDQALPNAMKGEAAYVLDLRELKVNPEGESTMRFMFAELDEVDQLYLPGVMDTRNVTDMSSMFDGRGASIRYITGLDLDTSSVTDMRDMFAGLYLLRDLDLSSFDMGNVTRASGMFSNCHNLSEVTVGEKFRWVDGNHLPVPVNVPGSDGHWYSTTDGTRYRPEDIPSNRADTYVAYPVSDIGPDGK